MTIRPKPATRLAAAFMAAAACSLASADDNGSGAWRVAVEGVDASRAVAGECAAEPMLDVAMLGLEASISRPAADATQAVIEGRGPDDWTVGDGALAVTGPGGTVILECPARVDGSSVVLPLSAIARILGWSAKVDRAARLVQITRPTDDSHDGWETFSVPKPTAEPGASLVAPVRDQASTRARPLPPPATTPVRVGLVGGYVQGEDFRAGVTASGSAFGLSADLGAFLTYGDRGLEHQTSHLRLSSPDKAWWAEAGDLFSQLDGMVRGVRTGWRTKVHRPEFSLFLRRPGSSQRDLGASIADELALAPGLRVRGELTSTGSYLLRTQFDRRRVHLALYTRDRSTEGLDRGRGGWASIDLGRGVVTNASFTQTRDGDGDSNWRTVALRVPVGGQASLSLERTRADSETRADTIDAATLTVPVGPFRLHARYQDLEGSRPGPGGSGSLVPTDQQDLLAVVSFGSGSRVRLDYQASMHWRDDAPAQRWDQMTGSIRLARSTRFEFTAPVPDPLDSDRLRLRLVRDFGRDLTVQLEYGILAPYQRTQSREATGRGLRMQVARRFTVQAPAGGGEVEGTVTDTLGRPVPNLLVGLGSWRALTGVGGAFRFHHVPPGEYLLAADPENLPARFATDVPGSTVRVKSNARVVADLVLASYGRIEGRVCVQRTLADGSTECGGVVAVVRLDDRVTATSRDGRFAFSNVPPGAHTVSLDAARLGRTYEVLGAASFTVETSPERVSSPVEFKVRERPREVVWQ